jgi:nitric-oxide synthase
MRERAHGPSAGPELASAVRFIRQFHDENRAGPPERRLRQVRRDIAATGTYRHTPPS